MNDFEVVLEMTGMKRMSLFASQQSFLAVILFFTLYLGMNDFEVVLEMTGMERMSLFASQQSSLAVMLIYFWGQFV